MEQPSFTAPLYQSAAKKSREISGGFSGPLDEFLQSCTDTFVLFGIVRAQAIGAILNAIGRICKIAATVLAQSIQRAVAEQAIKSLRVSAFVAGKIFAGLILEKCRIFHSISS